MEADDLSEEALLAELTAEPDPNLQRAYRYLLGNDFERNFVEHAQLTAVQQTVAADLGKAFEWLYVATGTHAQEQAPFTFSTILVTDAASAVFGFQSWFKMQPPAGVRIGSFLETLRARWFVVAYASGGDRKAEHFEVIGSDGFLVRRVWLVARRKAFSGTRVEQLANEERAAWEKDDWLTPATLALRNMNGERDDAAKEGDTEQ